MKQFIYFFLTFFIGFNAYSQADACASATAVPGAPVNGTCSNTAFSLPGALANGGQAISTCNGGGGNDKDDAWYTFTATSTFTSITVSAVATNNLTLAVWSACPPSTELGCTNVAVGGTGTVGIATVIGTVYYVQLHRIGGNNTASSSGNICVFNAPPPPANDNPCGAYVATINPTTTCTVQTAATVVNATATGSAIGACTGTPDDDVWFSFTATYTSQNIALNNVAGSATDLGYAVYSGACGSVGSPIFCGDAEASTNVPGLTVGATYYVRVYTMTATTGQTTTFNFCVTTPPPPFPQEPCGSTPLVVNPTDICTAFTSGTTAGATVSAGVPSPGCLSSTFNLGCFCFIDATPNDVWYSFTATTTTHYVNINNVAGTDTDPSYAVYSGNACSSLTLLNCNSNNNGTVTGLTVGATYYVSVYNYDGVGPTTFDICIGTPPPPPANDECSGAYSLTVNSSGCAVVTYGSVTSATASSQANNCFFGNDDDDVWFQFTATAAAINMNILNIAGSTTDLYHSVYSGTCGSIGSAIICNDNNSTQLTGLTIGNVYYVRVYSNTGVGGQTTSFNICLQLPPPPPTNLTCGAMQPICSGSPVTFTAQATGTSAEAGNNYSCLSTTPNPTWFYLKIQTPGVLNTNITAGADVDFALWGPYSSLGTAQAACGTLPAPIDCSYSTSPTELSNIPNALVGQVYVLLVTNYANTIQAINLTDASGNTATTDCSIVIPLPVELTYFTVDLENRNAKLQWATASEHNSDYIAVQRSLDGTLWETITIKTAKGNSSTSTSYSHVDEATLNGITYYRIMFVDIDGSFEYSSIKMIDKKSDDFHLFPNPVSDYLIIETSGKEIIGHSLKDISGRNFNASSEKISKKTYKINTKELNNGIYILDVITNEGKESFKILIEK